MKASDLDQVVFSHVEKDIEAKRDSVLLSVTYGQWQSWAEYGSDCPVNPHPIPSSGPVQRMADIKIRKAWHSVHCEDT